MGSSRGIWRPFRAPPLLAATGSGGDASLTPGYFLWPFQGKRVLIVGE